MNLITLGEYFGAKYGHPDATPVRKNNARELLRRVNSLLTAAAAVYPAHIDPDTGTRISGSKGGSGDGGFRLQGSSTGVSKSRHKEGDAVDVYDPDNVLDKWLTNEVLAEHGLYREDPADTPGWVHLQTFPPGSGRRTFKP